MGFVPESIHGTLNSVWRRRLTREPAQFLIIIIIVIPFLLASCRVINVMPPSVFWYVQNQYVHILFNQKIGLL